MGRDFTYYGEPRGQGRPRFSRRGNYTHTYKADKDAEYERALLTAYRDCYPRETPLNCPVSVDILCVFSIPKNVRKADRIAMLEGRVYPEKKPDIDNCVKAVLDALNGEAWEDDKHVVSVRARKIYGEYPSVDVMIKELEEDEVC